MNLFEYDSVSVFIGKLFGKLFVISEENVKDVTGYGIRNRFTHSHFFLCLRELSRIRRCNFV